MASSNSATTDAKKADLSKVKLELLDDEDFDRVVSRLEIFVLSDPTVFEDGYLINGVQANITHPDKIDNPNEKWIDLRGDKFIYLKVTFDQISKCRNPICDLNFYKVSRCRQQPDKMMIKVNQNIQPLPVKVYGDPDAEKKYKKTKKPGKKDAPTPDDDMYSFYGDYDLTPYFEDVSQLDPRVARKNLCLCVSQSRNSFAVSDIHLVVGDIVD